VPTTPSWLTGEASIEEVMNDPIVHLVMESDRVGNEELWARLHTAAARLTPRRDMEVWTRSTFGSPGEIRIMRPTRIIP